MDNTSVSAEVAQHTTDVVLAKVGTGMTLGGSGTAFLGGLALNEWAIIFGMVVGAAGLCVQWFYKHKLTMHEMRLQTEEAERRRREHEARMGMYQ